MSDKGSDKVTEKLTFKITGMHCTSCPKLAELTLKDLNGVESVDVDYPSGDASVVFDPALQDRDAISSAVRELGYEAHF